MTFNAFAGNEESAGRQAHTVLSRACGRGFQTQDASAVRIIRARSGAQSGFGSNSSQASRRPSRTMTPNTRPRSRGALRPRFAIFVAPFETEGAGNTGCTLHPRSRVQLRTKTRARAYRFSGNTPPSLRNGFTAYFVLSPVNGSFATVAARSLLLTNLTPAPRRQDHTTSPYASRHTRQSWRPRPPHLSARS